MLDKALTTLNSLFDLEESWDGEDAVKPNHDLIKKVISFVLHLEKNNYIEPKVELFFDGYIGLYWENKEIDFFAEIDFYEDNINGCYIKEKEKIHLSEDFEIDINNLDSKNLNILFSFIKKDDYV